MAINFTLYFSKKKKNRTDYINYTLQKKILLSIFGYFSSTIFFLTKQVLVASGVRNNLFEFCFSDTIGRYFSSVKH